MYLKTLAAESVVGRICVFGQKRPGTPGNSYFAQLPPVFGHFMFHSGGLLDCSNGSEQLTAKFRPGDVKIDNIFPLFFKDA